MISRQLVCWGVVAVCFLPMAACATLPDDPSEREEVLKLNDPLEPANRAVYRFNSGLSKFVFTPFAELAKSDAVSPVSNAISNVLQNLREPMTFVNDVAQGHECAAGQTLRRFMVNSTIGLGGLFDVAKSRGGLNAHDNDFGTTLGVWGVESGPYLFLPLLGPSDVRQTAGMAVEYFADPVDRALTGSRHAGTWVTVTRTALDLVDQKIKGDAAISVIENTSLDPYAAIRSAYRENIADQMKGPGCVTYREW